jgi:hypothetical protein
MFLATDTTKTATCRSFPDSSLLVDLKVKTLGTVAANFLDQRVMLSISDSSIASRAFRRKVE